MASMSEYCEKLSTSQLQALLREECESRGALPLDDILVICDILSRRHPELPDVKQTLLNLCRVYLEE